MVDQWSKSMWWCVAFSLLAGCSGQKPPPQSPKSARATRPVAPAAGAVDPVPGDAPLRRSPLEPASRDYVFPIPKGFAPGASLKGTMGQAAAQLGARGGTMLVTRHKGFGDGPLVGVIAVAPAVPGVRVASDPARCAATARTLGSKLNQNISFAGLVPVGTGRGCQIRARAGESSSTPHRRTIITLVEQKGSAWIINCTLDDRDLVAIQGCKTVIAGWRFVRK